MQNRWQILNNIPRRLAPGQTIEDVLRRVAYDLAPAETDWCAIGLLESSQLRRVVMHHQNPAQVAAFEAMRQRFPMNPRLNSGLPRVLRSGKAELTEAISLSSLAADAQAEAHFSILAGFQLQTMVAVPLMAFDQVAGSITLTTAETKRRHDQADLQFAMAIADKCTTLLESRAVLQDTQRQFFEMITHELYTPLAPILGYLDLLNDTDRPAVEKGYIAAARKNADRLHKRIRTLVDYAYTASYSTQGETVQLGPFLDSATEAFAASARVKRIDFCIVGSFDREAQLHLAAPVAERILHELLDNAVKFTDRGRILLDIQQRDRHLGFTIQDSGPGIKADQLHAIFLPFVRAQCSPGDLPKEGLGLGLTLARHLAAKCGGDLFIKDTRAGEGSAFCFALPILRPSQIN